MNKKFVYPLYLLLFLTHSAFCTLYGLSEASQEEQSIAIDQVENTEEENIRRRKFKTLCYLTIKNNLQVCNDMCAGNNVSINNMLTVGKSAVFNNPVTINFLPTRRAGIDALTVNGNTDLNGNVTIRGDLIIEGDIIGSITNINIADGSITTSKLADGSVTEPKFANNAVSTRVIQNGVVTNAQLATATFANDPNTIVLRDGTGSVSAQNIEFQSNTSTLNILGAAVQGHEFIGGHIAADGTIITAAGDFTITHQGGSGSYTIDFTYPFSTTPITTATIVSPIISAPSLENATLSSIEIHTYDITSTGPIPGDQEFLFITLGMPS